MTKRLPPEYVIVDSELAASLPDDAFRFPEGVTVPSGANEAHMLRERRAFAVVVNPDHFPNEDPLLAEAEAAAEAKAKAEAEAEAADQAGADRPQLALF